MTNFQPKHLPEQPLSTAIDTVGAVATQKALERVSTSNLKPPTVTVQVIKPKENK